MPRVPKFSTSEATKLYSAADFAIALAEIEYEKQRLRAIVIKKKKAIKQCVRIVKNKKCKRLAVIDDEDKYCSKCRKDADEEAADEEFCKEIEEACKVKAA